MNIDIFNESLDNKELILFKRALEDVNSAQYPEEDRVLFEKIKQFYKTTTCQRPKGLFQ